MKISNLIFFSIIFILILFSITTYVNYTQAEEVRANTAFLAISSNIVKQSNQFQRNILYMERGMKGYITTGDLDLLNTYDSATIENSALLNELLATLPEKNDQYKKLLEINNLYNEWLNKFAAPVIAKRSETPGSKGASTIDLQQILKREEHLNKSLQQKFREFLDYEYVNRAERRSALEKSEYQTKYISILLTLLSIVIGLIIAILLTRYISGRISKLVKMANSIAAGNYKVQVKAKGNDELSQLTKSLNHMAQMLEENISLLQRKNKELDQFAHIVSHDLKAPLRGIDNVISWIEEDHEQELPPKVKDYLQIIKGRISRSENFIQGILSFARIGKEKIEKQEVDVKVLVNEILENILIKPGLRVIVDPSLPILTTEKIPLLQVFSNLISNALKYNDKADGQIKIYSQDNKTHYEFFVEDNGPGIDEKYHSRVFIIFQTLNERDTLESTGVGLAIVKKILDERKEQIKIISKPGDGAIFSFTWSKY